MNVLITGGTGYVGSILAELYAKEGHSVHLVVRSLPSELHSWSSSFKVMEADILNQRAMEEACKGMNLVINCATVNEKKCEESPAQSKKVNVDGVLTLLQAAELGGVRHFVQMSTFHVYGKAHGTITEATPIQPSSLYAKTKAEADQIVERFAHESQMHCTILRFSNGYGAPVHKAINRWSIIMLDLCKQAVEKGEITLLSHGLQKRDFVYVGDILPAITAIEKGAYDTDHIAYNLGSGSAISMRALAQEIATAYKQEFGTSIKPTFADAPEDYVEENLHFSIDRLKKLGFQPQDVLKDEILKTITLCKGP